MYGLLIILPGEVDGYIQAIRDKNTPTLGPVDGPNSSFVNAGNERERHWKSKLRTHQQLWKWN